MIEMTMLRVLIAAIEGFTVFGVARLAGGVVRSGMAKLAANERRVPRVLSASMAFGAAFLAVSGVSWAVQRSGWSVFQIVMFSIACVLVAQAVIHGRVLGVHIRRSSQRSSMDATAPMDLEAQHGQVVGTVNGGITNREADGREARPMPEQTTTDAESPSPAETKAFGERFAESLAKDLTSLARSNAAPPAPGLPAASATDTRYASDAAHAKIAQEMDEAFIRNVQKHKQIQDKKRADRKKLEPLRARQPLSPLAMQLKRHWAEYLPRMTAELDATGNLHQQLEQTAAHMRECEIELLRKGVNPDQAREMVRDIGFLASET